MRWLMMIFFFGCTSVKINRLHTVIITDREGKILASMDNDDSAVAFATDYWFKNYKEVYVIKDTDGVYACGNFNLFNPALDKIDSSSIATP